jgi:abortive infection bacteriophage resistance protein
MKDDENIKFKNEIKDLLKRNNNISLHSMGFPEKWKNLEIWKQ